MQKCEQISVLCYRHLLRTIFVYIGTKYREKISTISPSNRGRFEEDKIVPERVEPALNLHLTETGGTEGHDRLGCRIDCWG